MPTKKSTKGKKGKEQKASLLRQLTGAVVGGSLALGIYYGYQYSAPVVTPIVTAWLTVPQDQLSVEGGVAAQTGLKESEQRRIAQRARFIVDTFGQEVEPPAPKKDTPANWDLEAIGNMEQAADEGWGDWSDEWPEPPVEPQEEKTEEWDAAWDDTWDDDFEALSALAYENDPEEPQTWDDTWDESYWGGGAPTASAVAEAFPAEEEVQPVPAPLPVAEEVPVAATQVNSAPELPSSGVELWLAALVTLGGTVGFHRRRIACFMRGKM